MGTQSAAWVGPPWPTCPTPGQAGQRQRTRVQACGQQRYPPGPQGEAPSGPAANGLTVDRASRKKRAGSGSKRQDPTSGAAPVGGEQARDARCPQLALPGPGLGDVWGGAPAALQAPEPPAAVLGERTGTRPRPRNSPQVRAGAGPACSPEGAAHVGKGYHEAHLLDDGPAPVLLAGQQALRGGCTRGQCRRPCRPRPKSRVSARAPGDQGDQGRTQSAGPVLPSARTLCRFPDPELRTQTQTLLEVRTANSTAAQRAAGLSTKGRGGGRAAGGAERRRREAAARQF